MEKDTLNCMQPMIITKENNKHDPNITKITVRTITEIVAGVKNRKVPKPDNVPNELIKDGGTNLILKI